MGYSKMLTKQEELDEAMKLVTQRRDENNLCAYYYSFEKTGNSAIDLVLASVAMAGKRAHNTEDWTDDFCGPTCVEIIQEAANIASKLGK